MRKIYITLSIILATMFLIPQAEAIDYTTVEKDKLVYEITKLELTDNGLHIKGWAFLGESQHFSDPSRYRGEIILKAARSTLKYPITFTYKNMTELMRLDNVRKCEINEFKQAGSTCYYEYNYVGFNLVIPYDNLEINSNYIIYLGIETLDSHEAYKTLILAPTDSASTTINNKKIVINAGLNRTHFLINHDFVYARLEPSKNGKLLLNNKSEAKHGNYTYYELNAQFNKILEYRIIDDISWYHIKGKIDGIKNDKYIVNEGETYDLWVASTFVQYNGSFTTIMVTTNSTGPTIISEDSEIYKGDTSFNPLDHVWAYDDVDGPLEPILLASNLNINKVGKYMLIYKAVNSQNKYANTRMLVNVIEPPIVNTAPKITAENKTVYLNESIDYLKDVSAYDYEDGDITSNIQVTKKINSRIIGIQEACYYVEDSGHLTDTKCISIEVISPINEKGSEHLRFISINNPFNKEAKPLNWNFTHLLDILNHDSAIKVGTY